jgi:trk system potassium uptake protein TrkH
MDVFNSVNHALTTLSTGGYSPQADSIGAFDSVPIELVAIGGMILGSINFAFYWRAVRGKGIWPQFGEIRVFLLALTAIIAVLTAAIVLADDVADLGQGLRDAAFTSATVMTGTGYTTVNFDGFSDGVRIGLLILMFSGGCAASTTGGIKVIRATLLAKIAGQEIDRQLQPSAVRVLRLGGRAFSEQIRTTVLGFLLLYLIVFAVGAIAFAGMGLEPMSALGGAATQLNIVGPGLGETYGSFQAVPEGGRLLGALLMLTGRLEVFTVVALLAALLRLGRT